MGFMGWRIYFRRSFLLLVIPDSAGPRNRAPQEKVIASVLTDGDTNGVSQNAIAARIRALDKTIKEQGQLIKTLTEKYGADQTAQRLSNLENNQKKSGAEVAAIKKRVDTVSNPVPYSQQSRGATPLAGNGQRNVPTLYKPEEISAPSVAPRNSGSFNNGKTLQRVYEDAAPLSYRNPQQTSVSRKGRMAKQYQARQLLKSSLYRKILKPHPLLTKMITPRTRPTFLQRRS
jgi:conjugal transfer pilus assembly protein TraB